MIPKEKKLRHSELGSELPYHILLWALLIGPHSFFSSYLLDDHFGLLLYCIAISDGLLILIVYFVMYYLIGKYFDRRKYLLFALWLLGLSAVYILLCVKMEEDISIVLAREQKNVVYSIYYFINISRYTLIGFLLYRLNQGIRQQKKLEQMAVEKLRAEVNYLRAQINPHFLFNTLNNLYGLSLQGSQKTPELIIRLSKMMDYMLYEVEGTKVLLQRDLENLLNYIEMERIRQGNNAVIHYSVEGEITNQVIEPLLFLPLVENAFKHGVNQIIDGAYLEVKLIINDHLLTFSVKNNYKTPKVKEQFHQSLGLTNLKKRLELFYSGRHSLDIYDDSMNYHVTLKIHDPFNQGHHVRELTDETMLTETEVVV